MGGRRVSRYRSGWPRGAVARLAAWRAAGRLRWGERFARVSQKGMCTVPKSTCILCGKYAYGNAALGRGERAVGISCDSTHKTRLLPKTTIAQHGAPHQRDKRATLRNTRNRSLRTRSLQRTFAILEKAREILKGTEFSEGGVRAAYGFCCKRQSRVRTARPASGLFKRVCAFASGASISCGEFA